MSSFDEKAKETIAAEFRMISGCADCQTSADVSNVSSFQLPDPHGKSGGACTSALLKVLYADHKAPEEDLSFQDVLVKMRDVLKGSKYEQIPQLSASRPMDIETKFDLVPNDFEGERRAVIIGINYVGQKGELSGCHNDAMNMKEYIMDVHGFPEENIAVLLDDDENTPPTYENILNAYTDIVSKSKDGDSVFCHYSGHGGKVRDEGKSDEEDGYDETLVPVDYDTAGQIRDDDILKTLVLPMAKGVFATSIMDCCHSGTVLDLPYNFKADGEETEMSQNRGFPALKLMSILQSGDYKQMASFAMSSEGREMFSTFRKNFMSK